MTPPCNCKGCERSNLKLIRTERNRITGKIIEHWKCGDCGVVTTHERLEHKLTLKNDGGYSL